jgi:hypothetical protein
VRKNTANTIVTIYVLNAKMDMMGELALVDIKVKLDRLELLEIQA